MGYYVIKSRYEFEDQKDRAIDVVEGIAFARKKVKIFNQESPPRDGMNIYDRRYYPINYYFEGISEKQIWDFLDGNL